MSVNCASSHTLMSHPPAGAGILPPLYDEIGERYYRSLIRTRHEQRERCAWIPSRRGRCESDRGARVIVAPN
jgi:hypothetical protein